MSATPIPQDNRAYRFPFSVKGVVFQDANVIRLTNEREEWELPGGKLEPGESPEGCVVREIEEELGLRVRIGPVLDTWLYHLHEGVDVLIITYGCYVDLSSKVVHSPEHRAVGTFSLDELKALKMPEGYKKSIRAWSAVLGLRSCPG